jgi:serine/threonine protein kinase
MIKPWGWFDMDTKVKNLSGQNISSVNGQTYLLTEIAGQGAQGVVYKESSGKYMVKLYYPSGSDVLDKDVLEKLSFVRSAKKPRNFVEICDLIKEPYIGYVMDRVIGHKPLNAWLIPPQATKFTDWYNAGLGFRERLFIGYIIAKAFSELSADNLSYCDISGNNILVKIDKNASVRMIDIDNIYIAGRGKASVLGTPRYIAPEVISKAKNPDVFSDNYSLAVILFELLRIGHPYVSDEIANGLPEDEENAYAGKADYVTADNSTDMLPEDIVFTDKLKDLFSRCFVDGTQNRINRPAARDFEYALLEACNKVIKCPVCGAWHFPKRQGGVYQCPWCEAASSPKAFLNFFDRLYEDVAFDAKAEPVKISEKPITSFILRDGKNTIKNFYVLRSNSDNPEAGKTSGNYFTIVNMNGIYHLLNEFDKDGIRIKQYGKTEFIVLKKSGDYSLNSGDEIYFGIDKGKAVKIDCGEKPYRFIRVAKFAEDKK